MRKRNGQQWDRIQGVDLDPNNVILMKANKGVFESQRFKEACSMASIPETKRQSSKFRRKFGLAYKMINGLI